MEMQTISVTNIMSHNYGGHNDSPNSHSQQSTFLCRHCVNSPIPPCTLLRIARHMLYQHVQLLSDPSAPDSSQVPAHENDFKVMQQRIHHSQIKHEIHMYPRHMREGLH